VLKQEASELKLTKPNPATSKGYFYINNMPY
jgi:hypothetical protein